MKVYKFGGASVKDAKGVRNIANILKKEDSLGIVVVISAMGKTTNALEIILKLQCENKKWEEQWEELKWFHFNIISELFITPENLNILTVKLLDDLKNHIIKAKIDSYDFHYDQIVSIGEILSTTIVSQYLTSQKLDAHFSDARRLIFTDASYRKAKVDMDKTAEAVNSEFAVANKIWITQGFIGSTSEGLTTTLGREGSDYSAAIFAFVLGIKELTIWKDVDGVYNVDPKLFTDAVLIEHLSYKEAVELAFYGASIIHPKTIWPLQEKGITLKVRSFYHLGNQGTIVNNEDSKPTTSVIVKKNQVLLSLTPRDFSFMDEKNMSIIFHILSKNQHQINLTQNSAISFSLCVDENYAHFEALINELMQQFHLRYNRNQVLVTIRHYNVEVIDKIYAKLDIKMEQRNRATYQVLISEDEFENGLKRII